MLPVNRALTGPTLVVTFAVQSVGVLQTISSQPGMHWRRISGLLIAAQTVSRGASMRYSPVNFMLRPLLSAEPARSLSRL